MLAPFSGATRSGAGNVSEKQPVYRRMPHIPMKKDDLTTFMDYFYDTESNPIVYDDPISSKGGWWVHYDGG